MSAKPSFGSLLTNLRTALAGLSPRKRAAVWLLALVVLLTWLAACVVLASLLA